MTNTCVCRQDEESILEAMHDSDNAELLALYGRRRVGKTYLIRSFFSNQKKSIFFNSTGMKDGSMQEQIESFTEEMATAFFYKGAQLKPASNWRKTFKNLSDNIDAAPQDHTIVLFFDEFPWMATKNSRLLQNLEYFWNQHWSKDKRVKLIICGSAASWIIKKIVHNKAGLHNRLTREMLLEPLDLKNTKKFLNHIGMKLNNRQVLNVYLVTGGIPYYLSRLDKNLSVAQNIEALCFKRKGFLIEEFDKLFASLFDDYTIYVDMIRAIASKKNGIGQNELFLAINPSLKGKSGLDKLDALTKSNFIIDFKPMLNSVKGKYYKVIDEYVLFYLSWIEPIKQNITLRSLRSGYFTSQINTPKWNAWSGLAFEAICFKHIIPISEALQLSPTAIAHTWRYIPKKYSSECGAQIDLLFDRDDDAITLCEIKYTEKPFVMTKEYAKKIQNKVDVFKKITRTEKQIFVAMICASGINANPYSDALIHAVVTLEDIIAR